MAAQSTSLAPGADERSARATPDRSLATRSNLASRLELAAVYACLGIAAMLIVFPFVWMVSTALKSQADTFAWPPILIPATFEWGNFGVAWTRVGFGRVVLNTIWVVGLTTLLSTVVNSLAGFGFGMYQFRGQTVLFAIVLATLMVPFQVTMVPLFLLVRDLALTDTYIGLIVPRAADAFGIFLMRQFLQSIPKELAEAARIDGCSEFRIYWNIVMPLAMPAIAVMSIFTFVWRWNDLLWPLIVTSKPEMRTLQLALATFQGEYYVEWNYLMAATLLSLVPMLAIFLTFQRYFVRGISLSGMK